MKVVKRIEIPTITSVEMNEVVHQLGKVKIFRSNNEINKFLPPSYPIAFSWVRLECGEELVRHKHPEPSLILVADGTGQCFGDFESGLESGDVVLVPGGASHGFKGGENGFWALSIQFNELALYSEPESPRVKFQKISQKNSINIENLKQSNNKFLNEFENSALMKLLNGNEIFGNGVKDRLLSALQIWSDFFQRLLLLRAALTTHPKHRQAALVHLNEEIGHNDNLRHQRRAVRKEPADPALTAIMEWFKSELVQSTDAEKTLLMHLVIESSGEIFHRKAAEIFPDMKHFQEHGDDDGGHVHLGVDLLKDATATEFESYILYLEKGWSMMILLCDRMAALALPTHTF